MSKLFETIRRSGWIHITLVLITVFAAMARFVGVTQSPPGFYIDEAAISAQVICVQQSGASLQGENWPLFTEVLGGGYLTPAYLYPAVAWVSLFDGSIESFRLFTAFFSLLSLAGIFVFARRLWQSADAAWLATLAAAISPWVFQFARIAWDPALAPAYLVWAFAALWGKRRWELGLSGVLFGLAAYSYPPLRVQIALTLPLAILYLVFWRKRDWKPFILAGITALLTSLPLIKLTISGEIQGRFAMLSVFNSSYLQEVYGEASLLNGLHALIQNIGLLLSPSYLLISGDANLRHSTSTFGIWSWVDTAAVLAATGFFLLAIKRQTVKRERLYQAAFVVTGYLAGILPAAMTWESNPHALRSIGATVFLAIGVGGVLSHIWNLHRLLRPAVLFVAAVFFTLFLNDYFGAYPKRSELWFDTAVTGTAIRLSTEGRPEALASELTQQGIDYDQMAVTYYDLFYGVTSCRPRSAR